MTSDTNRTKVVPETGDQVNLHELEVIEYNIDDVTPTSTGYDIPDRFETVTVLDAIEDPEEKELVMALSTEKAGFIGLVRIEAGPVTIVGDDDNPSRRATLPSQEAIDDCWVEMGVGMQTPGSWVWDEEAETAFCVLNTTMSMKWYYFMALGRNGEFEKLVVHHDSEYIKTAPGGIFPEGWHDLPDENIIDPPATNTE